MKEKSSAKKKRCQNPECNKLLPISEFYKHSMGKDGLDPRCKKCKAEYGYNYVRTINGVIGLLHSGQLSHSKRRGDPPPSYSKARFFEIALSDDHFLEMYKVYKESGFDMWLKPSCDRINDYDHYHEGNIQFMTWRENFEKHNQDKINGVNTKQCKAVLQYDMNGNFIAEYYSMAEAERQTGICYKRISDVCNGKMLKYCGFVFKKKSDV